MSEAENKELVKRIYAEWWTKANLDAVDELVSDRLVCHNEDVGGKEGIKKIITEFRRAFPDLVETPDVLVAEGDRVVSRFIASGTHQGVFMGIEPTGKAFSFTGIDIYQIADGKVTDWWFAEDLYGLLEQLGGTK